MKTHTIKHLIAAQNIDWNNLPATLAGPCFHVGLDGHFCGLPERFHPSNMADRHPFVSLGDMLRNVASAAEDTDGPTDVHDRAHALLAVHGGTCSVPVGSDLAAAFYEMEKAGLVKVTPHGDETVLVEST